MPGPMLFDPYFSITAGGRIGGEYARAAGTDVKALAPVRGRTMLDRVIDAAMEIAPQERIAVIGGAEVRALCESRMVRSIAEAETGGENVRRALGAWPGSALIYLTSDMPYVTGPALRRFLENVTPGSVAMPVCEHTAFCERFPDAPPFGITLAGERVVNGGAFVVPAPACAKAGEIAGALFNARKSPARMAGLVGPMTLLQLLLRRLPVTALERRAEQVLGCPAFAIRNCAPELAYDADTVDEYAYACARD